MRLRKSECCGSSPTMMNKVTCFRKGTIAIVTRYGKGAAGRGLRQGFTVPSPRNCEGTLHLVGRTRGFRHPIVYFMSAPKTFYKVRTRRHKRNRTVTQGLCRVSTLGIPILSVMVKRNKDNNTLTLTITSRI